MKGGDYISKRVNDTDIIELYNRGMYHREIAEQLGCAVSTITNRLIKMGIRTRVPIDKDKIVQLHEEGRSDIEIAKILGCTRSNITIQLNRLGYTGRRSQVKDVEVRNRISQSLIGRYTRDKNPNYKGYTNEKMIARGIFKTISKRLIRNRDYTCEHCGRRGGDLETHHIKPFKIIFDEFIKDKYNGDINTIYKQLMSYNDFTDESNMVVLCHDCHHQVHYTDNRELSPYRWESATTIENL